MVIREESPTFHLKDALIGLIDSFDNLTNSEKTHRKKRNPFDAMMLIKNEVLNDGRFDKGIYKDLCLSLGKKPF
jgi:hypothetical protein